MSRFSLRRILSTGQTGVDRAALDIGRERALEIGGWCSPGRRAEDGRIPSRYPLQELSVADDLECLRRNARDADATLVLSRGPRDRATMLALRSARQRFRRPTLVVPVDVRAAAGCIAGWISMRRVRTLHVAGPRESTRPGIYAAASAMLRDVLAQFAAPAQLDWRDLGLDFMAAYARLNSAYLTGAVRDPVRALEMLQQIERAFARNQAPRPAALSAWQDEALALIKPTL